MSAFQIVGDVDRMGASPCTWPDRSQTSPGDRAPEEVRGYFAEMGWLAIALASQCPRSPHSLDHEAAALLEEDDDAMDDLHRHLFTVLMDRDWDHGAAAAVDVTLLGRYMNASPTTP